MEIQLFRSNSAKIIITHILAVSSIVLLASSYLSPPVFGADELNALVWCDHADPNLLKPFEEANNVKVNVKEYEGTGTGLAIVEQSKPGDWDLMVIDSIDVRRAVEKGLFAPLPESELPITDMFPEVVMDAQTKFNGKRYAVTEKFGYVAIGFNRDRVSRDDLQQMSVLWGPKFKGRIAIYDYYLPMIGLVALGLGKKTTDLKADDLPAIKDALVKMKANARMTGEITASQTALATGEVDILVGGGEFVTAGLRKENPAMEFTLPQEGGILWSQALGLFADSKNKDLALKFVKYVMSPEGQERLATASCFWGMPASRKAKLSDDEKRSLRFDEQPQFLARSQLAPAPDADLDKKMQDLWTEVLQAK